MRLCLLILSLLMLKGVLSQSLSHIWPKESMTFTSRPEYFHWNKDGESNQYQLLLSQDSTFNTSNTSIFTTQNDSIEMNNNLSAGLWYWKVIPQNLPPLSHQEISTFIVIDPLSINSLKIWLKPDTGVIQNNGLVEVWQDYTGNNDLFQITNSSKPTLENNVINNLPSIYFDGNDILNTGNLELNDIEIFVLFKGENTSNKIFGFGGWGYFDEISTSNRQLLFLSGGNYQYYLSANEVNKFQIHNFGYSNGKASDPSGFLFKNQISITKGVGVGGNSNEISNLKLGTFTGHVAEVLVFDTIIDSVSRNNITKYLFDKYAPRVNLGPDITIDYGYCDTVIVSNTKFESYLWSNGSTDSSMIINEPGEYWLEGIDIFGRSTYDTIIINRPPFNDLFVENQIVCFNETGSINANIPNGNYSFQQWSDGNTNPTRILNQNESISYTVIDNLGCIGESNTAIVSIDYSLQNISLGFDTSLCSGNAIQLVQDTSVISNWFLNTQDTTTTLSIDTSGIYILDVSNINGCQNSDTIEVTVIGTAPSLSYSIEN